MTEEMIKSCAHCGSTDIKQKRMRFGLTDWYFVRCINCLSRVQALSREKAIEKWNRRV